MTPAYGMAEALDAAYIDAVYRPDTPRSDWDGSLWGCTLLGAALPLAWAYREVDDPSICKAYIKSNKPHMADVEVIGEAVTRPTMRFVSIKELAQQDFQAL
jgi:hypothetical protein